MRKTFMRRVQERFFLRFHMSLILLATALSGVLTAKVLLLLHVDSIMVRYPLAVVTAYLAFFLFVKLWLKYVAASQPLKGLDSAGDVLPDLPSFSGAPVPAGQRLPSAAEAAVPEAVEHRQRSMARRRIARQWSCLLQQTQDHRPARWARWAMPCPVSSMTTASS